MAGPTLERLREILEYNPATGEFRWRISRPGAHARSLAGSVGSIGYVQIMIDRKQCLGHRLAWMLHYGVSPKGNIDHKDRDRANNRITNLRECTQTQNNGNMCGGRSKSGFKGVYLAPRPGRYYAQIKINGKKRHLGYFSDPVLAHEAYFHAAQLHFGEFARAA